MNRVPGSQSLFFAGSRTEKMQTEVLYCSCYNKSVYMIWIHKRKESLPLCKPMNWKHNQISNYGRTKREIAFDFEFDVPIDVVKYEKSLQVTHTFTKLRINIY